MKTTTPIFNSKRNLIQRWIYAFKLKSWPKLLVPFLLGQAIGVASVGKVDWWAFTLSFFAIAFGVVFIVLMNDWGDQRVDKIKREMFPDGCSPKTIPDGLLPAKHLLVGGVLSLIIGFSSFVLAGLRVASTEQLIQAGLVLTYTFIAYTLPPIKLNYRGGGELLEMLGVGLLLPWSMAFLQTGEVNSTIMLDIAFFSMPLALASAIASGLSDEESDRLGGKNTFVTMLGNAFCRKAIEVLTVFSALALIYLGWVGQVYLPLWSVVLAMIAVCGQLWMMRKVSVQAITNAFKAQGAYKNHLHNAFWWSSLLLSFGLVVQGLIN